MNVKKLFDREWYFRKFMRIFTKIATDEKVAELQLKHKIRLCYEATFKQPMHWLHPRTLNEKLLWIALYWQHPLKTRCADKWKVRDYITKDCGLPESLLVPLIGVYNSSSDIDFDSLPNQFVLKCNHGCGYNILVEDKSKIDKAIHASINTIGLFTLFHTSSKAKYTIPTLITWDSVSASIRSVFSDIPTMYPL